MEQQQNSIFNFSFDETSKDHIKTISQWAAINAILAFVGLVLDIVQFIILSNGLYRRASIFDFQYGSRSGLTLFFQVIISVLLNVFLYNASIQLKKGINGMDNGILTKGFGSLRTYYKIYGIILIVVMVLGLLGIIFISSFRRF
jgi:hypothetical protein